MAGPPRAVVEGAGQNAPRSRETVALLPHGGPAIAPGGHRLGVQHGPELGLRRLERALCHVQQLPHALDDQRWRRLR
eukprot:10761022-Lingulodinium_polyedra.AAC.1